MISPQIEADSLEDFYAKLCAAYSAEYGPDYLLYHEMIREKAAECSSYLELGVNQGSSLACALLAGYRNASGVDISLANLRPHLGLFESYAKSRHLGFTLFEMDSCAPAGRTDFLFIDSKHHAPHLNRELRTHAGLVRSYILVHDTSRNPELFATVRAFTQRDRSWEIEVREVRSVGFTLLRKIRV